MKKEFIPASATDELVTPNGELRISRSDLATYAYVTKDEDTYYPRYQGHLLKVARAIGIARHLQETQNLDLVVPELKDADIQAYSQMKFEDLSLLWQHVFTGGPTLSERDELGPWVSAHAINRIATITYVLLQRDITPPEINLDDIQFELLPGEADPIKQELEYQARKV